MDELEEVLATTDRMAHAYREYVHRLDESDRQLGAVRDAIVDDVVAAHASLFVDEDEPEWLDEELIDDAKRYVVGAGDAHDTLDPALREVLDAHRDLHRDEVDRASAVVAPAAKMLAAPKAAHTAALHRWVMSRRECGSVEGWSTVLTAWRESLGMTTRTAASVLGVSPSAVTRYESGARSPSMPQLISLVESMNGWDPLVEDTFQRSTRMFAQLLGGTSDDAVATLERADAERLRLEAELEEAVASRRFSIEQLRLLTSLCADPDALDHLVGFARADAVAELFASGAVQTTGDTAGAS